MANNDFYAALKLSNRVFDGEEIARQLSLCSKSRVSNLAKSLSAYISKHLPETLAKKEHLGDYRTNPYVLMTSASVMHLSDPKKFANFLFNNKLYAGLETSFGKSIESHMFSLYPIGKAGGWETPVEKIREFKELKGMTREDKARARDISVWREIDKSCFVKNKRYLLLIKSGPHCINDTQVTAMTDSIVKHRRTWWTESLRANSKLSSLDIVVGVTYGTDKTTNNKENQILVKLLEHGFIEEDRTAKPGVLIDSTKKIRVYRRIGIDFWATVGNPLNYESCRFVFLEILLALARSV